MLAWLSNASIILLDEPFEGLDVEAISAFSRFLVSQQQASLVLTANKLVDIPKNMQAQLIVMDDLAITWKSEDKLNYDNMIIILRVSPVESERNPLSSKCSILSAEASSS